jgi:hypothetical protein
VRYSQDTKHIKHTKQVFKKAVAATQTVAVGATAEDVHIYAVSQLKEQVEELASSLGVPIPANGLTQVQSINSTVY